jgi:site-specific recombinase XerD
MTSYVEASAAYLQWLEHVKRASAHTLTAYTRDLLQLQSFLHDKKHGALANIQKLDVIALRGFLASRYQADATTSVLRKLSAIRGFLKHCKRERWIAMSPAVLLESPKRGKPLPRSVSVDEAFALCNAPAARAEVESKDVEKATALCTAAVTELLYGAGLRVAEL